MLKWHQGGKFYAAEWFDGGDTKASMGELFQNMDIWSIFQINLQDKHYEEFTK